ncbi:hypothetical protein NFI96_028880, partial [Prochilodus magdalenae]
EESLLFSRERAADLVRRAEMIEVVCNDRLGKKVRVKCNSEDTIGDLKKLIAAQTGTRWDKIVLKKWYTIFKDHVTLGDSPLEQSVKQHPWGRALNSTPGAERYTAPLEQSVKQHPWGRALNSTPGAER